MADQPDSEAPAEQAYFSRDVIRSVPWVMFSKVVLFFAFFGISVILVRFLGPEQYGLLKVCDVIATWLLVLCGLGLNMSLVRFAPELVVRGNRAGLYRLVRRSAWLQGVSFLAGSAVVLLLKPEFDAWYFKTETHLLLLVTVIGVGARMGRLFVEDILTSLFRMKFVSSMSTAQGFLWLALTVAIVPFFPTAAMAINAQTLSVMLFVVVGGTVLARALKALPAGEAIYGVGKRRVLTMALSSMIDAAGLMFLRQYSEVFFLSLFFTPTLAGIYGLGCETPLLVISFIPMAIQKLFMAGFAEAYTRDEACLGRLIASFYRALILAVVPFAAFGVFFSGRGIELIYGAEMKDAGPISAIFCVLHLLSTIWTPLSLAIIAKEKIYSMLWLTFFQVLINVVFDLALIPMWGMYGAAAAVFLTFVVGGPIQLYAIKRIVGGIYFPGWFFVKITVPLVALAAVLSPLAAHVNVVTLFALGGAYLLAFPVMIRVLRLIHEDEVREIRALNIHKLNRVIDFFVRPAHA